MTPLPKRKHSTRRQGKKWAAFSLPLPNLSACPQCGELKPPHRVCPKCGYYKGREVFKREVKDKKKNENPS